MKVHRVIVMAVFAFAATALNTVPVRSAIPSLDLPMTPREQSVQLSLLARPETARRLFPSTVAERNFFHFQRDYRRNYWDPSPYGRALQVERVDEQDRARLTAGHDEKARIDTLGLREGLDFVYWDHRLGLVRVLEAKGGNSQPGRSHDSWPDTMRIRIRATIRAYRSPIANKLAKTLAARSLQSIMQTNVVMGRVGQSTALGVSSFGTFMRHPMTRLPVRSVVPGLKVIVKGTRLAWSAAGGIIGGIVGSPALGVGGVVVAAIGRVAAEVAAYHLLEWYYYRDFDVRQLQLVNAAVDKFYGLDSANDADPH